MLILHTKHKETTALEKYFIKVPGISKGTLHSLLIKNTVVTTKILMGYVRKVPRHVVGYIIEERILLHSPLHLFSV